ncbi:hypothetical protein BN1232_02174 [Mycobacterium numidiamassiliense]|uniref:ESX-1 secretion-associated protein EspA/EspE-like domain-containing protein n=1 Tax=Mycobacterium numidiamassiliense TaxID=1841861 RepID=A0A2U3PI22_9MYCO|nr:EspA/EspE family type VII secretion system effector [Mycobacterium numidiamassiliense]SPM43390.1 hypothetical protein BN1232_02174 [Mycobacterium numidiamassiliense]
MVVAASEIGGLVGSLAGIGKNAASQDWIATGLGAGALGMETTKIIVKGIAERRIKAEIERGLQERTNPWAAEVPIIEWGIVAITVFEFCLGLGDAKGIEFDNARSKLDLPKSDLESAFPDSRWEGTGSQEYAGQNRAQLNRVILIRDQDKAMMDTLTSEAAQLTEIRRAVAGIKDGLTGCIFIALLIKAYGSDASSLVFQKVVTLAAITATVSAIGYMEFYSGTETRPKVKKVVEEYEKLITEMKTYLEASQLALSADTAPAKESRVSSFSSGSGVIGMPDAATSVDDSTPSTSTIVPSLSQLIHMSTQPVSGVPSVNQLIQEPARADELSGQRSALTNPVNPQPGATTRQRKAATTATEQAAPAGATPADAPVSGAADVAGAAAGAEAFARTPDELAAPGAEQAPEPSRPQRTL